MSEIKKVEQPNLLAVEMIGIIDERLEFSQLNGKTEKPLKVDCKRVTRINSVGVKNWIRYFSGLTQKKIPVTFEFMPPCLVEQLNAVQNFNSGGTVVSILLPYKCKSCQTSLLGPVQVSDIPKLMKSIPETKCPKCQGVASFDDLPEEYFEFYVRSEKNGAE